MEKQDFVNTFFGLILFSELQYFLKDLPENMSLGFEPELIKCKFPLMLPTKARFLYWHALNHTIKFVV